MIKKTFLLILLFSSLISAQVAPPALDLTIGSGINNYYTTLVAENTINDNILVVTTKENGPTTDIISRMVRPDGTLGTEYTIASGQKHIREFDLVWHPVAKRYMLVFYQGDAIYVRVLRATGKLAGSLKKVTDHTGGDIQISPADKRRFVLFISREGKLNAISLRKNGKIFRPEKTLIDYSGMNYQNPSFQIGNAVMNNNNESLAYFIFDQKLLTNADISTVVVDHKLNLIDTQIITTLAKGQYSYLFKADYNPEDESHAFAYGDKYFSWYESRSQVEKVIIMPSDEWILNIRYDSFNKRFNLLSYTSWENYPSDQGTRIFDIVFNSTSQKFVIKNTLYTHTGNEVNMSSVNICFNPLGIYLLTYAPEYPTEGGLKGKLFN